MEEKKLQESKKYLANSKPISKNFVSKYIAIYEEKFSDWNNELDNIFMYRYVDKDNHEDLDYFRQNCQVTNLSMQTPIKEADFKRIKDTKLTKVFIIREQQK